MTLLEVLVAMTVLAIGVVGALGAVSACVRANTAAEQYSLGTLLAERVAAELDRLDTVTTGQMSGSFDSSAPDYTWVAQVGGADEQGLYPVQITILWHNKLRHLELDTSLRPHALPAAPPPPASTTGTGTGATGTGGTGNTGGPGGTKVNS
jgi:type II secretion system protein I